MWLVEKEPEDWSRIRMKQKPWSNENSYPEPWEYRTLKLHSLYIWVLGVHDKLIGNTLWRYVWVDQLSTEVRRVRAHNLTGENLGNQPLRSRRLKRVITNKGKDICEEESKLFVSLDKDHQQCWQSGGANRKEEKIGKYSAVTYKEYRRHQAL